MNAQNKPQAFEVNHTEGRAYWGLGVLCFEMQFFVLYKLLKLQEYAQFSSMLSRKMRSNFMKSVVLMLHLSIR